MSCELGESTVAETEMSGGMEALLLGRAQDAGVPQAGCTCARCVAARLDPQKMERVVSLGLIDREAGACWLIDATPDFREQLHALLAAAPGCELAGILLTHAHMGHYTGLIHLGKEAWHTSELPLYATPAMLRFLSCHAPWSQLLAENLAPRPLEPDVWLPLSRRLAVRALRVPHRGEWSDTVAYLVRGVARTLLYCPDIDGWDGWGRGLAQALSGVEVALLDATFYDPSELPGRDISQIPHPLVTDTVERVRDLPCRIVLVHLNHSNPLYEDGPQLRALPPNVVVGQVRDRWEL